ncbi:MAG: hypothetical protein Q8N97_08385 [Methanobacteriaceae archaeon]|nr:hypothetical protein [Methanobacteriaceae archaeon]MDP3034844.1 hypothetical protein [Methanobacteriaceae archaeon]MDP3624792.1 hypothetical protein [Methanobacteriaceae archaeon]
MASRPDLRIINSTIFSRRERLHLELGNHRTQPKCNNKYNCNSKRHRVNNQLR